MLHRGGRAGSRFQGFRGGERAGRRGPQAPPSRAGVRCLAVSFAFLGFLRYVSASIDFFWIPRVGSRAVLYYRKVMNKRTPSSRSPRRAPQASGRRNSALADDDARLDAVFTALADPTRRAILALLARGEATVTELVEPFALSQPAISKHLKMLERAGLVSRARDAQRRPRRLEAAPMAAATEWLEAYRVFWERRYAALDGVLAALVAAEKRPRRPSRNPHVHHPAPRPPRKKSR